MSHLNKPRQKSATVEKKERKKKDYMSQCKWKKNEMKSAKWSPLSRRPNICADGARKRTLTHRDTRMAAHAHKSTHEHSEYRRKFTPKINIWNRKISKEYKQWIAVTPEKWSVYETLELGCWREHQSGTWHTFTHTHTHR